MDQDHMFVESTQESFSSALEQIIREGARRLLQEAVEMEVTDYIAKHLEHRNADGHRLVTRNGHLPQKALQTGIGPITVKQPRVRDRREGKRFSSSILPPYARRAPSVETVIPTLYLKGISTGDFPEALGDLLGNDAKGLSPTNIVRFKKIWEQEYLDWQKRDLSGKRYVYVWADGIWMNLRLAEDRPCLLVLIGALEDGRKEVIAIHDGHRESKLSWKEVLTDLKQRGLLEPPHLAIGDGALGFWTALEEEYPRTRQQRCWVHKTANLLDKMPKKVQPTAKQLIHNMYMSENKMDALKVYDSFLELYEARYPGACKCLRKDKEQLFTFYDFPAIHWQHIRTTNPIESTFATVRHRTRQTKGCGSRMAALTMTYKLAESAQKGWKRLKGHDLIAKVVSGVKFENGEEKLEQAA
jgi:putative transposase